MSISANRAQRRHVVLGGGHITMELRSRTEFKSVSHSGLWVLVANASVQNSAVTKFVASAGFGVTAFQMFFFAGFAFAA